MRAKSIIILIIVGVVVILSAQNTGSVQLEILVWQFSLPLILLIYGVLFTGFIVGLIYGSISRRDKTKKKPKKYEIEEGDNIYPENKNRKKNK
ncbi:MAG: LapA family protein [Spirochaetota bacterium]